ncbi:MAG TPA: EAL domain-containing protein, partial [Accumulibacter sp.]|nr:EAL domain-containing protein [Accumulibacter sp.]
MQSEAFDATLLIVDDQAVNLAVLEELLLADYRVLSASSGRQALEIVAREPLPDLILLDIMMPDMDGYAVLAALQAQPATKAIPVLFLTALSDPGDQSLGLSLGAVDYILKPIQPVVVLARIRNQLELKHARDILRDHNAWLEAEVARRVDENRRIEDANRQAQARLNHQLETILGTAGEGIYGTDANGLINFVNPAVLEMFGYSRDELIGLSAHAILHHSNPNGTPYPLEDCPLVNSLTAGLSLRDQQDVYWRKDGTPLSIEYSSVPIVEADRIVGAVISLRDISERKRYLAQLERKSNYDDLTGLPNRNLLADRLTHAISQPRADRHAFPAVLAIKTDRLEGVRDTLGRASSDQVIVELANRLTALAQPADTLARLEADEFVLVTDLTRAGLARAQAQAILAAMAQPVLVGEHDLTLGASVGIALFPKDGETGEELIRHAFSALHKARAEGGGRSRYYASEIDAQALERLELEGELRRAIANGELRLYYQPQVSLRSGRIVGVEALVRWQHPTRGLLLPGTFITLAEESGLIFPLSEWVLRQACLHNKAWQNAGLRPIRVSVNFSARQFVGPDLVTFVDTVLRETGLDPRSLEIELTERAVMADPEAFVRTSQQLSGRAVSLEIVDCQRYRPTTELLRGADERFR